MISNYLKDFTVFLEQYKSVLIYGAGGIAKDMLTLLRPYIAKEKLIVVVTKRAPHDDEIEGYPIHSVEDAMHLRDDSFIIISVMPVLASQIESHIKKLGFKKYCTAEYLIQCMYAEIWKSPIKRKKLVFSHFNGKGFGGNPKLYE